MVVPLNHPLSPLGSDAPNGFPWLSQVFREGFQKKRKPPCFTMVHGDLYGFMLIYNWFIIDLYAVSIVWLNQRTCLICSGWWFQTFFIFHNIWDVILPIDFHIFQRGRYTTNQCSIVRLLSFVSHHSSLFWQSSPSSTGEV